MQHSYHIHIKGLVQGVGFRPFVCKLAEALQISGWVSNSNNGVIIELTADIEQRSAFYHQLISFPPHNAVITDHCIHQIEKKHFSGFTIQQRNNETEPDLLLTPDIAICPDCKQEIKDKSNQRNQYAFTTCLNCGPRYSIVRSLPYDRENTTMAELVMCESCKTEYENIHDRRHYSQTNSCPSCAIKMHLHEAQYVECDVNGKDIIQRVVYELSIGKIVAVKGIGGYLLMCDATNKEAINTLRKRKHRPAKPFAILYPSIQMANADVHLRNEETDALESKTAPIVLCKKKAVSGNGIATNEIAPDLDKIGVMLPYSPLLMMLLENFGKPLIATSANISGSPIIFRDEDALDNLFEVADLILTYERDILVPQDDSVMQFTESGQKIILRRSRGLAPNFYPNTLPVASEPVLATGGELKSAFAIQIKNKVFISQYLGDQSIIESQEAYQHTLDHMMELMQNVPAKILIDQHPGYAVSQLGKDMSNRFSPQPAIEIQHHKAHFGAVLAENHLLHNKAPVLGFIWDGTGFGEDKQIWGSELFIYQNDEMTRVAHLNYFPQLLGDKMSKEPRLSALSLLANFPEQQYLLEPLFSKNEWQYYQKILNQDNHLLTSSMGRFMDGLACLLGIRNINTYEGESVMIMESMARNCVAKSTAKYPLTLEEGVIDWNIFMQAFLKDIENKLAISVIAYKIFYSLARLIAQLSKFFSIHAVAFSGGVFQNALLTDLIKENSSKDRQLYFHKQLSPNDECIGFGQLACYEINKRINKEYYQVKSNVLS